MKKQKYQINENELIIFDPELDLDLKSDLKVQKRYLYYDNKKVQAEMYYHQNLLHGPSTFYSSDGNILSITWFFQGKRNGKAYRYYKSSKPYSIEKYVNDLLEGEQNYFFEDGKSLKTIMNYKHGVLEGETKLFFENTKNVKRHLIFKNGQKLQDKIFQEDGKILDETKFLL